jgi:hypothetical protein
VGEQTFVRLLLSHAVIEVELRARELRARRAVGDQ